MNRVKSVICSEKVMGLQTQMVRTIKADFLLTWEKVHPDTEAQSTLYAERLKGHNYECILWKENYKCRACLIHRAGKDNCPLTIM